MKGSLNPKYVIGTYSKVSLTSKYVSPALSLYVTSQGFCIRWFYVLFLCLFSKHIVVNKRLEHRGLLSLPRNRDMLYRDKQQLYLGPGEKGECVFVCVCVWVSLPTSLFWLCLIYMAPVSHLRRGIWLKTAVVQLSGNVPMTSSILFIIFENIRSLTLQKQLRSADREIITSIQQHTQQY